MIINKRLALFMIVANSMLLAISLISFLYFGDSVLISFSPKHVYMSAFWRNTWLWSTSILEMIVFTGMYWVLKLYKRQKWLRVTAAVIYVSRKAVAIILAVLLAVSGAFLHNGFSLLSPFFTLMTSLNLFVLPVLLFFVRPAAVRKYYWCFALLMLFAQFYERVERPLYDEYGYAWLLLNPDFLMTLPFLLTLVMFVELYNLPQKQIDVSIYSGESGSETPFGGVI